MQSSVLSKFPMVHLDQRTGRAHWGVRARREEKAQVAAWNGYLQASPGGSHMVARIPRVTVRAFEQVIMAFIGGLQTSFMGVLSGP